MKIHAEPARYVERIDFKITGWETRGTARPI
jgi:hypothetical protein